MKNQFIVHKIGKDQRSPLTVGASNKSPYYKIVFITKGQMSNEVDLRTYELNSSNILIIPQGAVHKTLTISTCEGYQIQFTDDFFSHVQSLLLNGLFFNLIISERLLIQVPEEQRANLCSYFEILSFEKDGIEDQNHRFLLQNLMLSLLNKIESFTVTGEEEKSFIDMRIHFQKLVALIEENFRVQHNMKFYLESLHMTDKKINRISKAITGRTVSQIILDRIMVEAKRELCFSEEPIKTIAINLGYDSQYYFSRIFKKKIGHSPEEFRMKYAE